MNKIQIMTDSCADYDASYDKKYNIACIAFSIFFKGKEMKIGTGYDDKIKASKIFDSLRNGERIYTLPATEYEIERTMKRYLDEGLDILYVGCCAKQSSTIVKATKIAKNLSKIYPDQRIEVIDSLNAGAGEGLLVIEACKLLEEGLSLDEIKKGIYRKRKNVIQYAVPENLIYMSRANKISSSSALFGNLFGIKPILISDKNGLQCSYKQVRGREESLREIVRLFKENVIEPENQNVVIIHGDDLEAANYVKDLLLQDDFICEDVQILCIGPAVGITMGPNMVGVFGFGKAVEFVSK